MSRLSLAQTLPTELLTRIFGWLVEIRSGENPDDLRCQSNDLVDWPWTANIPDLRDCALVCRRWRPPAQQMLFRSIPLYEVDDEDLLDRLRVQPELAAAVQALDVELEPEDFDLEHRDYAGAMQRAVELSNIRLSVLELCTRVRHLVVGGVVPEQRERLVGILDGLNLESLVYHERDWAQSWPTEWGPEYLTVVDLGSFAQRPSLRNLEVTFRRREYGYKPLFAPIPGLSSRITALSIDIAHTHGADRLIAMASATLRRLSVSSWNPLPGHTFAPIFASLSLLEELDVFVFNNDDDAETSWFPTTLPILISLRRLVVNSRFADLSTLLSAPPTLEMLEYSRWGRSDAAVFRDLQATLGGTSSRLPYSTLRIPNSGTLDAEGRRERAALVRVCRSRGVELQVAPVPVHRFLSREHISFF